MCGECTGSTLSSVTGEHDHLPHRNVGYLRRTEEPTEAFHTRQRAGPLSCQCSGNCSRMPLCLEFVIRETSPLKNNISTSHTTLSEEFVVVVVILHKDFWSLI